MIFVSGIGCLGIIVLMCVFDVYFEIDLMNVELNIIFDLMIVGV